MLKQILHEPCPSSGNLEQMWPSQAEKLALEVAPHLIEVGARKEDEKRKR